MPDFLAFIGIVFTTAFTFSALISFVHFLTDHHAQKEYKRKSKSKNDDNGGI